MSKHAPRVLTHLSKFSIRHCALRSDTPAKQTLASSGLSGGCTKIGDVPKSPVPKLAALLPSAGIITLQVGRARERVSKAPAPRWPRHADGVPLHYKGQSHPSSGVIMTSPHY